MDLSFLKLSLCTRCFSHALTHVSAGHFMHVRWHDMILAVCFEHETTVHASRAPHHRLTSRHYHRRSRQRLRIFKQILPLIFIVHSIASTMHGRFIIESWSLTYLNCSSHCTTTLLASSWERIFVTIPLFIIVVFIIVLATFIISEFLPIFIIVILIFWIVLRCLGCWLVSSKCISFFRDCSCCSRAFLCWSFFSRWQNYFSLNLREIIIILLLLLGYVGGLWWFDSQATSMNSSDCIKLRWIFVWRKRWTVNEEFLNGSDVVAFLQAIS